MAFFKFRRGDDESPGAAQPESVEVLRKRARHRLIGAVVLVLAGVIGFRILFDTQPRPIAVDIPIDIPDRHKARPQAPAAPAKAAAAPQPPMASGPVTAAVAKPEDKPAAAPAPAPAAAAVASAPAAAPADKPKPEPKPEVKAEAKPEPKREPKPAAAPPPVAAEGRYVVQVGAFADANKAREMRLRVEKAGFKTYTNVAETKDGKRIRVRVGPFNTRSDADKAADRIKGLDLPAAILSL